ncbi:hypothetical protein SOVF_212320 [Spinacia oleracea]|nr:hypothetical protein SOVF_212320 [Spinacia oleracea]
MHRVAQHVAPEASKDPYVVSLNQDGKTIATPGRMWNGQKPVRRSVRGADRRRLGGRKNPGSPGASSSRLW